MDECKIGASCGDEHPCGDDHRGGHAYHEECCDRAERVMGLAKDAKHDLLKEKMKKLFESKVGKQLDKVAEVAVDAVIARMQHRAAAQQSCDQYEKNLTAAFQGDR